MAALRSHATTATARPASSASTRVRHWRRTIPKTMTLTGTRNTTRPSSAVTGRRRIWRRFRVTTSVTSSVTPVVVAWP